MTRNKIQEFRAAKKNRPIYLLLLGDGAIAAWLCFAFQTFIGRHLPSNELVGLIATTAILAAFACRLHRFEKGLLRASVKAFALGVIIFALGLIAMRQGWVDYTLQQVAWLTAALAILSWTLRIGFLCAQVAWPQNRFEAARWLILAGVATAVFLPYYRATSVGSGDAYWYTIMLADFTAQLHAGVFPVWVGQTEFAFNGAFSPLRLAPWFQYAGGLLDFLTCHTLNPAALKNAVIAINGIVVIWSAYGSLRLVTPRRPDVAWVAAVLWILCPGVLAPLMVGDLIMTFMAMAFLPLVVVGSWMVWTQDSAKARVVLAIGLAGTWLSHTPVALWCTLFAAAVCLSKFGKFTEWIVQIKRGFGTAALFIALGIFPIVSVVSLDNVSTAAADGKVAADQVKEFFPANFLPITNLAITESLPTYQLGYAALGAFFVALVLMLRGRPRGSVLLSVIVFSVPLFVLPVPYLNAAFWTHVPGWFVTINNVWPMQRLFALWAFLMFFVLAVVLGDQKIARRSWVITTCAALLALGGIWSGLEAAKLIRHSIATRGTLKNTLAALAPNNLLLTRYAYSSFRESPGYYSHGYMDPILENRLLDASGKVVVVNNADYAAPPVHLPVAAGVLPRLVEGGEFTAVIEQGETYRIEPQLTFQPNVRYGLRLEFNRPRRPGLLQALDPNLTRQYLLPDSGQGVERLAPPQAFGSLPTSGKVAPFSVSGNVEKKIALQYVGSGSTSDSTPPSERFLFARYWLYRYEASDLPIQLKSLLPYHVTTDYGAGSWLETPRMWLTGYRAVVNGAKAEVQRSPNNLVMIKLPPGQTDVTLDYHPVWWLAATFWLSAASWALVGLTTCRIILQRSREAAQFS